MSHKNSKANLEKEIKQMEEQYLSPDTPQNLKDLLRGPLEKAKKMLLEINETDKNKPETIVPEKKITKVAEKASEIVEKVKKAKKYPAGGKKRKNSIKRALRASDEIAKLYSGTSARGLKADARQKAKKPGERTSSTGHIYREYRANRTDISNKAPYLEKGGQLVKIGASWFDSLAEIAENNEFGEEKIYFASLHSAASNRGYKKDKALFSRELDDAIQNLKDEKLLRIAKEIKKDFDAIENGKTEFRYKYSISDKGSSALKELFSLYRQAYLYAELPFPNFNIVIDAGKKSELITTLDDFIEANEGTLSDEEIDKIKLLSPGQEAIISAPQGYVTIARTDKEQSNKNSNIDVFGYQTEYFTEAAKDALMAAITDIGFMNEDDGETLKGIVQNIAMAIDESLSSNDASNVHSLLQRIGMLNYKAGQIVDTSFINQELAVRKLKHGGITDKYADGGKIPAPGSKIEFLDSGSVLRVLDSGEILIVDNAGTRQIITKKRVLEAYNKGGCVKCSILSAEKIALDDSFSSGGTVKPGMKVDFKDIGTIVKMDNNGDIKVRDTSNGYQTITAKEIIDIYKKGGRIKSAIMRDRAYKSQEPHEQRYKRKTIPENPAYQKRFKRGGEIMSFADHLAEDIVNYYLPDVSPEEVFSSPKQKGEYYIDNEFSSNELKVFIKVNFGDEYDRAEKMLSEKYSDFEKPILEKVKKASADYELSIMSNDEDRIITFEITEEKFEKGGVINNENAQKLAREFSRLLWRDIPENMNHVIEENKLPGNENSCATHDYIDSNMTMDEAFTNVMGRRYVFFNNDMPETEKQNEEDTNLINFAWELAQKNDFYKGEKLTYPRKDEKIQVLKGGPGKPKEFKELGMAFLYVEDLMMKDYDKTYIILLNGAEIFSHNKKITKELNRKKKDGKVNKQKTGAKKNSTELKNKAKKYLRK